MPSTTDQDKGKGKREDDPTNTVQTVAPSSNLADGNPAQHPRRAPGVFFQPMRVQPPPAMPLKIDSPETLHAWLLAQKLSLALTLTMPHPATPDKNGKLLLIGSREDKKPSLYARTFTQSGALAFTRQGQGFCMADVAEVHCFEDSLRGNNNQTAENDRCYLPLETKYTGEIGLRDVGVDEKGRLFFVSTVFNALMTLGERTQTTVVWQPSDLEDGLLDNKMFRLTGLAFREGKPRYITGVNTATQMPSTPEGASSSHATVNPRSKIVDLQTRRIMAESDGHFLSPVWHKNRLWVLRQDDVKQGALGYVNEKNEFEFVLAYEGQACRCAFHDNVAFLGITQCKEGTNESKIQVINLQTREVLHQLTLSGQHVMLNDIIVLPNTVKPKLISVHDPERRNHLHLDKKPLSHFFTPPGPRRTKQKRRPTSELRLLHTTMDDSEEALSFAGKVSRFWSEHGCVFLTSHVMAAIFVIVYTCILTEQPGFKTPPGYRMP